ncbi:hypothetical protein [Acetobacter senegalensis]|uniref:hypothetical protein n=1 Tax=Acetobacter senegalensis TaxID=446692 RepID=UPI002654F00E|nr:hypothetical protein [Acetobacter senegalensis]MDN7350161.1 hypothetical protein [Acetobacter senegalensis]
MTRKRLSAISLALAMTTVPALASAASMRPADMSSPLLALNDPAGNGDWKQAAQGNFPNSSANDHQNGVPPYGLIGKLRSAGINDALGDFDYTPMLYQVFRTSDDRTVVAFVPYNSACDQAANDVNAGNVPLRCTTYALTFDSTGALESHHSTKHGCFYSNNEENPKDPTAPQEGNRVLFRISEKDHTISEKTVAVNRTVRDCDAVVKY